MIVDFTAQMTPLLWALAVLLVVLAAAIFASMEPDLVEVYLGEPQLLFAMITVAALVVATLTGAPSP
jgi:hypothetical protein